LAMPTSMMPILDTVIVNMTSPSYKKYDN